MQLVNLCLVFPGVIVPSGLLSEVGKKLDYGQEVFLQLQHLISHFQPEHKLFKQWVLSSKDQ
jgi:hypothetical protein